jgi:NADH-quinone oxidoreductase subunit K
MRLVRLATDGWRLALALRTLLIGAAILAGPLLGAADVPAPVPPAPGASAAAPSETAGAIEAGPIGLRHYLAVSAIVFGLGLTIIIVRRNAIAVLMGIELLLNSAALNFVAFSKFLGRDVIDGQVIAIFLIVIAAAEAAVALAIILNIFNVTNTVTVDEADELKG